MQDGILEVAYMDKNIVPRIATDWDDIALDLGFQSFETDKIKQVCDPTKKKCTDMLLSWLQNGTTNTWKNICDALQELDENKAADDLINDLKKEAGELDEEESLVPN